MRPHNLPPQFTTFVGRERAITAAGVHLQSTRLLTMTGPGGVGKTRLALQVAAGQLDRFDDGAWFVPLDSVASPEMIAQAVATALAPLAEVRAAPQESVTSALTRAFSGRRFLMILDNCEHLVDECARFVRELLSACPRVSLLCTSREPLGIGGELVMEVDPLGDEEAFRLFADRAEQTVPEFKVNAENSPAVAEICARLDGIPLAIELAAARVRVLPPKALADRLEDRFRLLTNRDRLAIPRHKTLRAVVEWSYNLLSEPERALWRRLSVFAGGFSLPAAEATCQGDLIGEGDVLPLLSLLADKSIIKVERTGESVRYHMLETLHAFGVEQLQAAGEEAAARRRHLAWYTGLAADYRPRMMGSESTALYNRLLEELGNLLGALEWAKADPDSGEAGLTLARDLVIFWGRWNPNEGPRHLSELLALPHLQEPTSTRMHALNALAAMSLDVGRLPEAQAHWEEALAIARSTGSERGVVACMLNLGHVAMNVGDYDRAMDLFTEGLEVLGRLDLPQIEAGCLNNLATLHSLLGRPAEAAVLFDRALAVHAKLDWPAGRSFVLAGAGLNRMRLGQPEEARRLFAESLSLLIQLQFPDISVNPIEWAAHWLGDAGRSEEAARLLGSVAAARSKSIGPRPPYTQPAYDSLTAHLRQRLGESAFGALLNEGESMALEEALARAAELLAEPAPAAAPLPAGLTAREIEVAHLVAQGLSDREVAAQLNLSRFTVNNHLRSIYGKLEISSRAALVTWAFQNGLAKAR